MWKLAALLILMAGMGFAPPARAGDTLICFDHGTARLSAEGYRAVRTLLAEQGGTQATAHIRLYDPGGEVDGLAAERLDEVRLEFARNGLAYGRIETLPKAPAREDCLEASVPSAVPSAGTPPYFALWHFWGPYFESGSAEVTPEWRQRLRFIVAGYLPGETRYCIGGHSDTAADAEVSLALSRRRAENVQLELIRQGVRWEDTEVRAYGETQLARPTADGVAEPLNRRVFVDVRERCPARH